MATKILPILIHRTKEKISIEMSRHKFERLADSLGLFRPEFLKSLDEAEKNIEAGRVKKLHSLKDLMK
jgi:hypothetical protein